MFIYTQTLMLSLDIQEVSLSYHLSNDGRYLMGSITELVLRTACDRK